MKKTQVKTAKVAMLGYTAALAVMGSIMSMNAAAQEPPKKKNGCTGGTANTPVTCVFQVNPEESYPWVEDWEFTGSNNVKIFAGTPPELLICGWHNNGTKTFGIEMATMTQIISGRDSASNPGTCY